MDARELAEELFPADRCAKARNQIRLYSSRSCVTCRGVSVGREENSELFGGLHTAPIPKRRRVAAAPSQGSAGSLGGGGGGQRNGSRRAAPVTSADLF